MSRFKFLGKFEALGDAQAEAEMLNSKQSFSGHLQRELSQVRDSVRAVLNGRWTHRLARRHLNKGQKAMAAAMARSFNEQSQRKISKTVHIATGYVAQSDIILAHAPDLAPMVLAGSMPLNEAYTKAQEAKRNAESDEAKMLRLRTEAPDLADQIDEERLTLFEAIGALRLERFASKLATEVENHNPLYSTIGTKVCVKKWHAFSRRANAAG
jgi:hypothetical protein